MKVGTFCNMIRKLPATAKLVVVRDQMTFGLGYLQHDGQTVVLSASRRDAYNVTQMLAIMSALDEEAPIRVDWPHVERTIKGCDYEINDCGEAVLEVEDPNGTVHSHTNCREPQGVTVGLIDGIIAMARVLRHHNVNVDEVQEALKDLRADEDVAWLLGKDS